MPHRTFEWRNDVRAGPLPDPGTTSWMAAVDPGRQSFEARVDDVGPHRFVLERTWFEPSLVGSSGDEGWVLHGGLAVPVIAVQADGGHHTLETPRFGPGDAVTLHVDWKVRMGRMRSCALGNLVCCLLGASGGWTPTDRTSQQVHLCSTDATSVDLDALAAEIRTLVAENHPIWSTSDAADPDGDRYWHVDGVGMLIEPHGSVRSTGQIGEFELRTSNTDDAMGILAVLG